jgi:predicted DNA-binding protein with PD1-like motif
MDVVEVARSRRLFVRVPAGLGLRDALRSLVKGRALGAATVSGHGTLEWVELGGGRRLDGPLEVLALSGTLVAGRDLDAVLRVVVSRETDAGVQVLGGRLVDAGVRSLDLVVDALEGVTAAVRDTVAEVDRDPLPPRARAAPSPPGPRDDWAAVAAASAAADDGSASSGDEEPWPDKGSWVDHKQFGLCRVDGDDPDGGIVIRLPSGVRKVIRLDFLDVMPPRFDGPRRIFPLLPKKR